MTTTLPSESANWVLPSHPTTFKSTLPNYEESLPMHVRREGAGNYLKSRGTLNIGDWAIEGKRRPTSAVVEQQPTTTTAKYILEAPAPKVIGDDAMRNYIKNRSSTPNLIYGNLAPPNPHHNLRVKREGRQNYEKNHNSQMKALLHNYGKLPLPSPRAPHTQGDMATSLFYNHQKGTMNSILNNYGNVPPSEKPVPHVSGVYAEANLQKGHGFSQILHHIVDHRPPTPEPRVKGVQAQLNHNMGQGHHVKKLFHEYGKIPLSARPEPKVKYDGVYNFNQSRGNAMKKAISQCPPSYRYVERPQSAPLWR